jgi:hypothetical protein
MLAKAASALPYKADAREVDQIAAVDLRSHALVVDAVRVQSHSWPNPNPREAEPGIVLLRSGATRDRRDDCPDYAPVPGFIRSPCRRVG